MNTRIGLRLAAVAGVLWSTGALASGLVAGGGLVPLSGLDVQAEMTDAGASVTERRSFLVAESGGVRFFRSLAAGEEVQSVTVGGLDAQATILPPAEADAARIALTKELSDPSPLRELGAALLVVEAQAEAGPWVPVEVEVHTTQPLAPHGTMRGIALPSGWHPEPIGVVSVAVSASTEEPLRALYAPYHTLALARADEHTATGSYTGYQRCSSFDVTVLLSTGSEPVHLDLLPFRDGEGPGTFMALLSPELLPTDIEPRDLALVVDRSGSMSGAKMTQAKAALVGVLSGLRPTDTFSVVAFDGTIEAFADEAVPATPANVEAAMAFVDGLSAAGSTNLSGALEKGLYSLPPSGDHPRYVVLLTDGVPTAGETDVDAILAMAAAQNEVGARIFAFGIGYDVNTVLLDKLALQSAGDALYVTGSVETTLAAFFAQIADPVVGSPALDVSGHGGALMLPDPLPDLFAGQTLVVVGQYTKPGAAEVVLHGSSSESRFQVTLPERAVSEGYVPRVWATRRVGALLEAVKLGGAEALAEEALALARRYGVVTDFTFFVVQDNGDAVMTYSPVPMASVGEAAVNTSSSLDSYQKGGGVDAIDSFVRYHRDRTFPMVGGLYTDTALGATEPWVDVRFGSPLYWSLLESEGGNGIGGFLALGAQVRFELLGRAFRVRVDGAEAASIPAPAAVPDDGDATVTWSGDGGPTSPSEEPPGQAEEPAAGGAGANQGPAAEQPGGVVEPADGPSTVPHPSSGSIQVGGSAATGCASAGTTPSSAPVVLLLSLASLAWWRRRSVVRR